jgi:hypothetical protein
VSVLRIIKHWILDIHFAVRLSRNQQHQGGLQSTGSFGNGMKISPEIAVTSPNQPQPHGSGNNGGFSPSAMTPRTASHRIQNPPNSPYTPQQQQWEEQWPESTHGIDPEPADVEERGREDGGSGSGSGGIELAPSSTPVQLPSHGGQPADGVSSS